MKSSLLLSFLLLSVVTADEHDDAASDITKNILNQIFKVSNSPSTVSPFEKWIHLFESKTPAPTTRKSKQPANMPKLLPIQADCFGSIPGSPTWINCMSKFQEDIAKNSSGIQEMNTVATKMPTSRSSAQSRSQSTYGGDTKVKFDNNNGVGRITVLVNNQYRNLKIEKVNRSIIISGEHNGTQKLAVIQIPPGVDLQKVNWTREGQAIVITGPPTQRNAGSVKMAQTGGGSNYHRRNLNTSGGIVVAPIPTPLNFFQQMMGSISQLLPGRMFW